MKLKGIYHMPGSRYYWYRWMDHGKRTAVSLKTDDLGEALSAVEKIKAGQWFTTHQVEAPESPVSKLVEDYLAKAQNRTKKPMRPRTAKTIKYVLLKFLKDNRIAAAQEINYQTVERWLGRLKAAGKSPDTLNKYAMSLRPFIAYLVDKKLMARTELERFEIPERLATGRKNWVLMDVANRVIAEAQDPELKFILFWLV